MIEGAFSFAKEAYKEKFRLSGENYIHHAERVAFLLDKMDLDPLTIAFGILHDVADDIPDSTRNFELKESDKKILKGFPRMTAEDLQVCKEFNSMFFERFSLKKTIKA